VVPDARNYPQIAEKDMCIKIFYIYNCRDHVDNPVANHTIAPTTNHSALFCK
jgi:hypothetical protein